MKRINFLKIGSVITAAAILLSSSAYDFRNILFDNYNTEKNALSAPVVKVLENTTSSDFETANVELLMNACEENDDEKIAVICDNLLQSINDTKEELAKTSSQVAEWENVEISKRLKKYEDEINVKSAATISALNDVKNGVNVEENLNIVYDNLYEQEEYHYSDAAPNVQASIDNIELSSSEFSSESVKFASPEPFKDDLDYSRITKLPNAIKAVAENFDNAGSIYYYIKNNFYTEAYYGSKKDPAITLESLGGNDLDQAALLVAVLRAKNIPARFVTGTVMITAEQAMAMTGSDDVKNAGRLIASQGRNVTGLTFNGDLVGYKMKRTWVEAYIPYTDYRGAGNQAGESVWVQLDPSFKFVTSSAEEFTSEFDEENLETLKLVEKAANQYPNIYDVSEYSTPDKLKFNYRSIQQCNEEYIPSSLPYTVLSVDDRYSFINEKDKDSITVTINGEVLLNSNISDLCYKQIIVSYEPASELDREIIDKYEKITDVPAYLVYVVPVITVGKEKYRGIYEAPLGSVQSMVTSIKNNGGTTMLNDTVYCGSMYAINLDLQRISPNEADMAQQRLKKAEKDFTIKNACSTDELGAMLDYAGKYYFSLCDTQTILYSGLMNINATKQLSFAITGYNFSRNGIFGIVRSLDIGSFYIDVAYNSVAAVSIDGNKETERKFMITVGTIESYLEGYIWEQLLDKSKTCISTVSVLNEAQKLGIKSRFICAENLEDELALCNVSDNVKSEVRNFVNQGLAIEIVPETLTIGDWTGTAYIALNLNNGSASYMISGGNAGGSSMNFEDLFQMNITMFQINFNLSLCSMVKGAVSLHTGVLKSDIGGVIDGMFGTISAAFSLGSAMKLRYDTYDFIFKYAKDGEACMKEFMIFTMQNMVDTMFNVISFIGDCCGETASKLTSYMAGIYSTCTFVYTSIVNGAEEDADPMTALGLLWDWFGKFVQEYLS